MKYKKGDKFIVEIERAAKGDTVPYTFKNLIGDFCEEEVDNLEKYQGEAVSTNEAACIAMIPTSIYEDMIRQNERLEALKDYISVTEYPTNKDIKAIIGML